MSPYQNSLKKIEEIAQSAQDGSISLDEFHHEITPKTVLNLLKLLNFAEEDVRQLQQSAQALDMGMFELADLFGDDKSNLPATYLYDVAEKVKVLLGRNVVNN